MTHDCATYSDPWLQDLVATPVSTFCEKNRQMLYDIIFEATYDGHRKTKSTFVCDRIKSVSSHVNLTFMKLAA